MPKKNTKEKGTVLIITSLAMVILLILGGYFLSSAMTESRISRSQITAIQAYYLAEAGINEAIWRLKNDSEWIENFETDPEWSAEILKTDILFSDSSYQVVIQNSEYARGQIIATSTLEFAKEKTSQRVIKVRVFKALGSLTEDSPFFTGGTSENIDISASIINIYNGNVFGNNNINIKYKSEVSVFDDPETEKKEGKILAGNNINISKDSQGNATVTALCSSDHCEENCDEEKECPPSSVGMPMVDFHEGENSYKKQALSAEANEECSVLCNGAECDTRCVFTSSEFDDLLWEVGLGGTLSLENEITYVTGPIELRGGRRLVVKGVLVADRTIDIGVRECWTQKGQKDCGFNQITIISPDSGGPSGLLNKKNISFGPYSFAEKAEITGLIYSSDEVKLTSLPQEFKLVGGMLGRKISITSAWESINVYLDNAIILKGIWAGPKPPDEEKPPYSPVVTIEHWEETY